jgi:hypothetical protein
MRRTEALFHLGEIARVHHLGEWIKRMAVDKIVEEIGQVTDGSLISQVNFLLVWISQAIE